MSEISLLVHRFRVEEESLLGQRRSANFKSAILLNRITIGLLALAAIIIALGYYLALRYLAYKKRVDARIQALNTMLEEKLQAKTAEATELTEQYNFVLENLLEGAFLLNFDYRYLYANQSFLKRFNWSKTGTIGRTFMSKHPGIEHHILFGLIQRCIEDRTPVRTETEFDALNGDKRYYDTSIQPIPQGVIILSNDITDRKKRELENVKYIKKLEEVLFKISHEVRHPVVQILGISQLLDKSLVSDPELEDLMGSIQESAKQLDAYTRDLSAFVTDMKINNIIRN